MNQREKEIRKLYPKKEHSIFIAMHVNGAFAELADKRGATEENKVKFNALLQDYLHEVLEADDKACYETLVALYTLAGSDEEAEQKEALSMVARKSIFTGIC